jgi:hypothetical protein
MSNIESSLMHAYIHASVANYVKLPLFLLLASFMLPMVNQRSLGQNRRWGAAPFL